MITVNALTAFEDNYIWLIGHHSRPYVAIVDPGDGERVIQHCQAQNLIPIAILITHHHWDHTNGITTIKQQYDIPIYGPAHENINEITHPLSGGDCVAIDKINAQFQVVDTPGHTAGHICYYGHGSLFCGDTLFAGGCGRLFEGTAQQMQNSLEKIRALPDETMIYCAHEYTLANLDFAHIAEPENIAISQRQQQVQQLRANNRATVPSQLNIEKQSNPFLRWDQPQLIKNASEYNGHALGSPAAVFAAVRQWKDDLD